MQTGAYLGAQCCKPWRNLLHQTLDARVYPLEEGNTLTLTGTDRVLAGELHSSFWELRRNRSCRDWAVCVSSACTAEGALTSRTAC